MKLVLHGWERLRGWKGCEKEVAAVCAMENGMFCKWLGFTPLEHSPTLVREQGGQLNKKNSPLIEVQMPVPQFSTKGDCDAKGYTEDLLWAIPHSFSLSPLTGDKAPDVFPMISSCKGSPTSPKVSVACLVLGYFPEPVTMQWKKDSGTISTDVKNFPSVLDLSKGLFTTSTQLTIPAASMSSHTYSCIVDHPKTKAHITKTIPGRSQTGFFESSLYCLLHKKSLFIKIPFKPKGPLDSHG